MKTTLIGLAMIIGISGVLMPWLVETPSKSMQQRFVPAETSPMLCAH